MNGAAKYYGRLPPAAQHGAVSLYGYWWRWKRQGGAYPSYVRAFAERDRWSHERWRQWQDSKFRELLRLAAHSPGYATVLQRHGLSPGSVAGFGLADLGRLPILTKDEVRGSSESFCPGGRPTRGMLAWPTSGSTGTPLMTYHSTDDLRRGLALREARYLSFAGVGHAMPRVTFGGRSVETQRRRAGPFHRVNLAERQIYFSVYHLSAETVPEYVRVLRRYNPRWLTGYASTIADLARLADAQSLECPPLSAVITAAESVAPHLRETAPRIFGCEVTEEYGLAEESCFALECEQHSLHVSPDAGVVEIVDANGDRCAPGSPGDIVATGLVREAQPLIRYRTGDRGSWSATGCACGREMPVIETLDGRSDDAVLTPDGRQVTRLTAVARGLREVAYMQFVQEQPDCLEVHVVAEGPLAADLQEEIVRRLQERLGSEMNIAVHRRDAPIRTSRGKVRAVISRLEAISS